MSTKFHMLPALLAALALFGASAHAQAPAAGAPLFVVTYFESAPAAANAVAGTLKQAGIASRKEDGNISYVALRESGRPNRFAIVEAWRDKAALDAHDAAMTALRGRLQPQLAAPFDSRACVALDIAPIAAGGDAEMAGSFYVLTHVDVIPTAKDQAVALVKQFAADSRNERGAQRFDVLQQGNRANHMFVVEAWRDRTALDSHIVAPTTRRFRDSLLPLEGALYDERIYAAIR